MLYNATFQAKTRVERAVIPCFLGHSRNTNVIHPCFPHSTFHLHFVSQTQKMNHISSFQESQVEFRRILNNNLYN